MLRQFHITKTQERGKPVKYKFTNVKLELQPLCVLPHPFLGTKGGFFPFGHLVLIKDRNKAQIDDFTVFLN